MYRIIILLLVACNKLNNKNKGKTSDGISYKNEMYQLHNAVKKGNIKVLKELLNKSVNVNIRDKDGMTLLHISVEGRCKYKEVVELLLNNCVDIDAIDGKGYTALMYASDNGNKEIVELLLSRGANINRHTALHIASYNGNKEIVELLLSNGANVNAENNYDETALHIASKNGYKEIIELLLSNGANVNYKSYFNETALMYASQNGHKDVVELLLSNGADLSIKNTHGKTVVDIAKDRNEYIELLSTFKKVIISKVDNDSLNLCSALKLLTQFKNNESIDIINTAVERMTDYYKKLEEYNLYKLELAIARLKTPMLFNYSKKLKHNYIKMLKEIILYISRSTDNLVNVETMKIEQKELLKQIAYGVSVITEEVDNKFVIKQILPEDIFNVIIAFFID